ncbi:malto-oligosyltrehalose trehalohydrolase [Anopheles sinensis]|uniref:Malto-oligosyltrehalose trehalohydrolase n=1 Tax=Anopheles sinensis TaxID=74873 RepID=A0A084WFV9_ANOSI|nr:malto-oligosyltrehalose trehalohydrolase [Anopheles sinensis]
MVGRKKGAKVAKPPSSDPMLLLDQQRSQNMGPSDGGQFVISGDSMRFALGQRLSDVRGGEPKPDPSRPNPNGVSLSFN